MMITMLMIQLVGSCHTMSNTPQKDKEVALNRILMLEKQLDEKQMLDLDTHKLRGKQEVVKHLEKEGVNLKKRTDELNE
jgi:hypothetical protein